MKRYFLIFLFCIFALGCATAKSIKFVPFTPIKADNVLTAWDILMNLDDENKKKVPSNAMDLVVVLLDNDRGFITVALYEFKEIYWLSVYFYNNDNMTAIINASDFVLMDSNRTIFRRLEPHNAANIYLAKLSGPPPYLYEPKYNVSLSSYTSGYVTSSGYLNAQTTTTGTIYEDPYNKLGYNLGYLLAYSSIVNHNKKMLSMAGAIYSFGLVDYTTIPSKSGLQGGIYWQKGISPVKNVILRIASLNYEVSFKPKYIFN